MSIIILLTVFMGFVFVDIKGLFKSNTIDIAEEAEKREQTLKEYKGVLFLSLLITFIFGSIFDVWASLKLGIPALYIGAALCILLNFMSFIRIFREMEQGKIVNKFKIRRFYNLGFDVTVLYFLIRMVLTN